MDRGSSKHGPMMDDQLSDESEPLERATKESRADEAREGERAGREDAFRDERQRGTDRDRHMGGSQSNADVHPHQEFEAGGASHPKPKGDEREAATERDKERKDEGIENQADDASADSFPASDPPAW